MFFFAILTIASLVAGAVMEMLPQGMTIHNSLPDNYTISEITWTMPIVEGGQHYTFHGTVQEVFAQVNELRIQQNLDPMPDPLAQSTTTSTPRDMISSRSFDKTICKVGLNDYAPYVRIEQGIAYLRKLKSKCTNGAGPGNCGRISCLWASAIYWCNDNDHPVTYDCSHFADYAQYVLDDCHYVFNGGKTLYSWGQAFDTERFNVLVGRDNC
ncbi:hypothetical protein GGR57DRAFT_519663 [Xylariaceae sp. FL1272]|nr:hypothetical protein GGR57DRAFT_519663 [Xylariaceae sp. FL1272]